MSNRNFDKKIAIALGAALSAGALNSVSVSAMEGDKQKEIELNAKINAALDMAQNVDANYVAARPKFKSTGLPDDSPIHVVNIPVEELRIMLDKQEPILKKEQISKIKNIVLKMGRFAIKEGYYMNDGRLLITNYPYDGNFRHVVSDLIDILNCVPLEIMLKTNILTTLQKMNEDRYYLIEPTTEEKNKTYLNPYYAAFDALERDIKQ